MLSARRNLECGLLSPTAFRAAETSRRLQNLELSRCQDLEQSHSSGVNCLSLDPVEGRYLLSGGADGGLCVHDLFSEYDRVKRTSRVVCKLDRNEAHRFAVSTVQWYPCDTGLFTSSGMDSELRVWDANALKVAEVLRLGAKVYSHHLEEAQPTIVALGTGRPWVTLADLRTGIACQELRGHSGKVLAVRWSPSAAGLLATASQDNKVMLWDIRCARGALAALKGHSGAATSLAFLPDGLVLFSLGADNRLRAWDIARRRELHFFGAIVPNERPVQMAISSEVMLVPSGRRLLAMDFRDDGGISSLKGAHFGQANCVLLCPLTLEAYSGAMDRTILCWTANPDKERAMDDHQDGLPDAWSSDEEM
ncbi:DNA excision repair protein ERCC-8-like [Ixodes scapularis]